MRWSKLKSLVLANIDPEIRNRININSTRYGNCTCGRLWITFDKVEIANFCTRAYFNAQNDIKSKDNSNFTNQLVDYGEFSRQDGYESCWEYINHLNHDEALTSDDPLIQCLAILDKKTGKRRLKKLSEQKFHPLVAKMVKLRLENLK